MKKFLCLLVIFLSGCATVATGPDFTPAPPPAQKEGLVYFMRSPLVVGEEIGVSFLVAGHKVVELYSKGYSWVHLPEGRHNIKAQGGGGKMSILVDVRPGETQYVERLDDRLEGNRYVARLQVARPQESESKIKAYKYTPSLPVPAPSEPLAAADPSKATVILYRSSPTPAHIDLDIIWSVDQQTVCHMEDRSYTVLSLAPGEHEVKVAWDPWRRPLFVDSYQERTLKIRAEAGQTQYVSYRISGRDGSLFGTDLVTEPEDVARRNLALATLIKQCRR
jgi:PAS domain-containing protein